MARNPKRIAVLAPEVHEPFVEGVQKTAWNMARGFAADGWETYLYTGCSYGQPLVERPAERLTVRYRLSSRPQKVLKYLSWVWNGLSISREVSALGCGKLVAFSLDWPHLWPLFWLVALTPHLPVTVAVFSDRELSGPSGWFVRRFGKRIDRWLVRSEHLRLSLLALGVDGARVQLALARPEVALPSFPERQPSTVAYFSSAEEAAGVYDVLELARQLPEVKVVLAVRRFGEREEEAFRSLTRFIAAHRLANVEVLRNLERPAELMAAACAVVVPPKEEQATMAVPMAMLEAFAVKTPVLLRRLPLFSEFTERGLVTGFASTAELTTAVSDLLGLDPERFSAQAERAYAYVTALPAASDIVKMYLET